MFITSKSMYVYFVAVMFCMLLVSTSTAVAQTASSSQRIATTSTSTVTITPEPTVVTSNTLTPAQQKRVTNLSANISNTLDATIVRLTNIVLRMQSRMRIIEQEGKDISNQRTQLEAAKKELERLRATLRTIDTDVAKVTSSEKPQQEWLRVRKTFVDASTNLQQVKQTLQEALNAMKTAGFIENDTTTPAQ
jgi:chromosome segregation ATPase